MNHYPCMCCSPWCYVGKQRLDKAIAAAADKADFDIEWHAYMIDMATKPEGEAPQHHPTRQPSPEKLESFAVQTVCALSVNLQGRST